MTPCSGFARALPLCLLLLAAPTGAAATLIDLAAEASRPAANDLIRATLFAEASGKTPGRLSQEVNVLIADALKTAKTYTGVKIQSGGASTYPVYAKDGKIEAWRMRSQLVLESRDSEAISELLGKLQSTLGLASLVLQPAPETRKQVENEAMLDAIAAFKARAKVIADALGKPYRIKQLAVHTNANNPQPLLRAAPSAMLASSAAMPVEAGESQVSASVTGQIELPD
jgi:predicted secreted protein